MRERTEKPSERKGLPVDLRKDGVLWMINQTIFHPRGYALAYSPSEKDFLLLGDGSERWYFGESEIPRDDGESDRDGNDRNWRAFHALLDRARER